jgi:hypothetical protein
MASSSASAAALLTPTAAISTTHSPDKDTVASSPATSRASAASLSTERPAWRATSFVIGGDKRQSGEWKAWYPPAIAEAEQLDDVHLNELREEGLLE